MTDPAIQELETKIAFLERHVEEQDRIILALRKKLDAIEEAFEQVKSGLRDAGGDGDSLPDERPPHY